MTVKDTIQTIATGVLSRAGGPVTVEDAIQTIATLPEGRYRWALGQVPKARCAYLGKPVRRRRLRMDAADVRWSQDVRERDRHTCQRCGASVLGGARIEAAHVVPRRYQSVRRVLEDGVTLCHRCHRWAHAHETEFLEWFEDEWPGRAALLREVEPRWAGWRKISEVVYGG